MLFKNYQQQINEISELLNYDIIKLQKLPNDIFSEYVTAATHYQNELSSGVSPPAALEGAGKKMTEAVDNLVKKFKAVDNEKRIFNIGGKKRKTNKKHKKSKKRTLRSKKSKKIKNKNNKKSKRRR